jgi:SAM-dependent methyltransferase
MTQTRYRLALRELRLGGGSARRLLDVGAGNGAFMAEVLRASPAIDIFGGEFSSVAIGQAHSSIRGRIALCDLQGAEPLPWGGGFEIATCMEVLEHLPDDTKALSHIRDALSPAATLLVTVPAWADRFGPQDRAAGHVRRYNPERMRALLVESGFRVKSLYCWGGLMSWAYSRAIDSVGPEKIMRIKPTGLTAYVADLIYQSLKLDDFLTMGRGSQLIATAERI